MKFLKLEFYLVFHIAISNIMQGSSSLIKEVSSPVERPGCPGPEADPIVEGRENSVGYTVGIQP